MFLGRRGTRGRLFALAIPYGERASISVWCSHVLAAPVYRNEVRTCDRLSTALGPGTRKKSKKSAHRGRLSLDNRGPHKCSAWRTFKIDDRRTHPREAIQIPGCSSPAGRSPAPRRPPAGHTDPPGATRPSSPDAGSGALATPPFAAPVPNPRGGCQRT